MSKTFRRDFLRASAGALALSGVASSSVAGQPIGGFTDWPMRGFDLQNTAHTPATPAAQNLEIDWTIETNEAAFVLGNGQRRQSLPAIANERVYVGGGYAGGGAAFLQCVDLDSGYVYWRHRSTTPDSMGAPRISSSPAVADGTVYFAAMDEIVALDAETGDVRWKGKRPKVPESASADHLHGQPYGTFEAPPTVYDGVVYVPFTGDFDGGIRGFDTEDGELVFEVKLGRGSSAGLAIKDGSIYYTGYYEGLKKIDIENESVVWEDRLDPYRNADCDSPPGDVPYRPPVISPSGQTHRIHVFGQPFSSGVMNTYTWQSDGKFVKRTTPQPEEKCEFNNADYWGVTEQSAVAGERVMSAFIMGTENGVKGKIRGNIRPDTEWKKEYENSAPMGVSAASNVLVTTINQRLIGLNAFTGEKLFEEKFDELDNWEPNEESYEILGTPIPTDNRYLIHTWGGQLVCIKGDGPKSSVTKPTTSTTTPATTRTRTDTPTTATQDPTQSTTKTTSTDVPGFGLGTGIAGVLGGAAALGHRLRRKPGNEE